MTQNTPPTRTWKLSDEVYRLMHRWPSLLIFALFGGLLGWVAAQLWPASYSASASIYVGINPYRVYEDARFLALARPKYTNQDDYVHWQMSQLKSAIFLDEILETALDDLRQQDTYWVDIDLETFSSMLQTNWRTAGRWSLVAEGADAKHMQAAANAWREAALARLGQALDASQSAFMTVEAFMEINTKAALAQSRLDELAQVQTVLQDWLAQSAQQPQDQPLTQAERWRILYFASRLAQFTPAWTSILGAQPPANAPRQACSEWITRVDAAIESEKTLLNGQINNLEGKRQQLDAEYRQQAETSLGLSPNLEFKPLPAQDELPLEPLRPAGLLILAGGFLGAAGWLLWQLAQIIRHQRP